jgi:hypothetical protein
VLQRRLLPGLQSEPGIAQDAAAGACVEADVHGVSWDDPMDL